MTGGDARTEVIPSAWALSLAANDAAAIGFLRLKPGILGAIDGAMLWIRGLGWSDELWQELRKVASHGCFLLLPDQQLVPVGRSVPAGRLPALNWMALSEVLTPGVQTSALPGRLTARVPLSLVRTDEIREANWLLLRMEAFRDWAVSAPAVRLARLSFACAADGRCLVRGVPLPPLPGTRLVEDHGIALPAGFGFQPPLLPAVVREVVGLAEDELAVWFADGHWEKIHSTHFVRATRAAVRASTRTEAFTTNEREVREGNG